VALALLFVASTFTATVFAGDFPADNSREIRLLKEQCQRHASAAKLLHNDHLTCEISVRGRKDMRTVGKRTTRGAVAHRGFSNVTTMIV
ncbi:MAG: hypothetical protein AAFX06_04810, partial [Planctomycetota bacterium]